MLILVLPKHILPLTIINGFSQVVVLGDSRKLCLSAKFLHQEIRWNYRIFRNGGLYYLTFTLVSFFTITEDAPGFNRCQTQLQQLSPDNHGMVNKRLVLKFEVFHKGFPYWMWPKPQFLAESHLLHKYSMENFIFAQSMAEVFYIPENRMNSRWDYRKAEKLIIFVHAACYDTIY